MSARFFAFTLGAVALVTLPARAGDPLAGALTVLPRSGLQFKLGENEKTLSGSYDAHLGLKSRLYIEGEVPISSDREALLFEGGGVPSGFRFTLRIGQDKYWKEVTQRAADFWRSRDAVCEAAKTAPQFCIEAAIETYCADTKSADTALCAAYAKNGADLTHALLDRNVVDGLIAAACRGVERQPCTITDALNWAAENPNARAARELKALVQQEKEELDKLLGRPDASRRRYLTSQPAAAATGRSLFADWGAELGAKYDRVSAVVGDIAGSSENLSSYQLTAGVHFMATWTSGLAFTARAGVERSQGVSPSSLERCRMLAGDDGQTGTACETVNFVAARPTADTSAYVRTALTRVSAGSGRTGEPAGELRANLENLGNGTTLDLQFRLFLTPAGQATDKGKGTIAGRLGIGLQASYALQDGPGGSYQAHTWRDVRPFGFVALTF